LRKLRPNLFALLLLAIAFGFTFVGCPCVRGAVNASPQLRWWLFANFGASKVCPEMLKRGVPLKLPALGAASIGRFYPQQCNVTVDNNTQSMVVTASGIGYAFLPVTRRVGFRCGVSVEYRPDFRLESDAIYVWGRYNRLMAPPDLQLLGVENPVVNLATRTPLGDLATVLGQGVVASEIGRGFTVVKDDDGGQDFTLGVLMPPARPKRAFEPGEGRVQLATDLVQVGAGAREYLGPFAIEKKGAALYMKLRTEGAPVDYYFTDRMTGDIWLQSYLGAQPLGPPPAAPLGYGTAAVGETVRYVPTAPGMYYVVLENRAAAPVALGLPLPIPEALSYVSYSIEVGDRP
jgi:hypothetical protein